MIGSGLRLSLNGPKTDTETRSKITSLNNTTTSFGCSSDRDLFTIEGVLSLERKDLSIQLYLLFWQQFPAGTAGTARTAAEGLQLLLHLSGLFVDLYFSPAFPI